eukprot:538914_1
MTSLNNIPLDWSNICDALDHQNFFRKSTKKSTLQILFQGYCGQESVRLNKFKKHLCKAYGNIHDDEKYMFHSILSNELKYSLKRRHQFYHILLYNYLELSQLNKENIIHVLATIIQK